MQKLGQILEKEGREIGEVGQWSAEDLKIRVLVYPEDLLPKIQKQQEEALKGENQPLASRIELVPPEPFTFAGATLEPEPQNWPGLAVMGIIKPENFIEARVLDITLSPPNLPVTLWLWWPRIVVGHTSRVSTSDLEQKVKSPISKPLPLKRYSSEEKTFSELLGLLREWHHHFFWTLYSGRRGVLCPYCGTLCGLDSSHSFYCPCCRVERPKPAIAKPSQLVFAFSQVIENEIKPWIKIFSRPPHTPERQEILLKHFCMLQECLYLMNMFALETQAEKPSSVSTLN